jgi:hypothetical protein
LQGSKLRYEAAKVLRRLKRLDGDDIPEETWAYLDEEGYILEATEKPFDHQAIEYIVERIIRLDDAKLSSRKGRKGIGQKAGVKTGEVRARLNSDSEKRAEVFREIAAMLASEHPDVVSFRENVLDGQLFTHEQAGDLLAEQGGPDGNGPILDALRTLGKRLAKSYRWRELDAMWFVLTGYPPPVLPLHTVVSTTHSVHSYHPNTAAITLTVEPWVSAEEVKQTYTDVRQQLLEEGTHLVRSERNLKALQFAVEKRTNKDGGQEPDYSTLWKWWNQENPDQRFPEYNRFWEAVTRAEQAIIKPKYKFSEKPYTPTPAQAWRDEHQSLERRRYVEEHMRKYGPPKLTRRG